jgi:DNA transformation protein and related proteins
MSDKDKLRNIGPKSAAWLRQVGVRSLEDLQEAGAIETYMRVKRAGFRPSLNLLYALEGALLDCHWQEIPDDRRSELILAVDTATAELPPPRTRAAALKIGPVTYIPGEAVENESSDGDEGLGETEPRED